MKNLLIAFGFFDLVSFYVNLKKMPYVFDRYGQFSIINTLLILTIASLLVTAILSILMKKVSLYVYYIQLPLRVIFAIFSASFLFRLFHFPNSSINYYIVMGVIVSMEIIRLFITIKIQRVFFKNTSTKAKVLI